MHRAVAAVRWQELLGPDRLLRGHDLRVCQRVLVAMQPCACPRARRRRPLPNPKACRAHGRPHRRPHPAGHIQASEPAGVQLLLPGSSSNRKGYSRSQSPLCLLVCVHGSVSSAAAADGGDAATASASPTPAPSDDGRPFWDRECFKVRRNILSLTADEVSRKLGVEGVRARMVVGVRLMMMTCPSSVSLSCR